MKRKVIVNADDFGLSESRNLAVVHAFKNGICTSGSIVVNTEYFDEAVKLAKENHFIEKIGLHVNLTYGRPLTEKIKTIPKYCQDNSFVQTNPRSFKRVFSFLHIKEIREEIEAQIRRFLDAGFTLRHVDAHNDILYNMPIWLAVKPLLKKYKIESIRGVEPYLFGYYRKSIISYLPLKYYFMCFYLCCRMKHIKILHGGRNINQYCLDIKQSKKRKVGSLSKQAVVEIIIHPNVNEKNEYIDLTNFNKDRVCSTLDDTKTKLSGLHLIDYNELHNEKV